MVAYNFAAQFAGSVESGEKQQTIRKRGKRQPPVVGAQLQLYTGMRTRSCRLLKRVTCISVLEIEIRPAFGEVVLQMDPGSPQRMILDSTESLQKLAAVDGFSSIESFFDYFEGQAETDAKDFCGHLIRWEG